MLDWTGTCDRVCKSVGEPIPEFYRLLDKVVRKVPNAEFTASEIYEQFKQDFANEMAKLQEKYKGYSSPKN
jgi:hypothetical protein